ncbi:autotransporter outer membrane beta-barrel domain-containing protein [candidate division TA06 bacterium]|nr:autotransporter outer membrane beta-barrel domain-containing protein [candidate division TA06 bacterium]
MKNKFNAILVLLAGLAAFGQAHATATRQVSMPGISAFTLDDQDIFNQPSLIPFYYRAVIVDLSGDSSRITGQSSVLLTYANREQAFGIIGLAVNYRSDAAQNLINYINPSIETLGIDINLIDKIKDNGLGLNLPLIPELGSEFDLMYARKFGDRTAGIRLEHSLGQSSYSYSNVENQASCAVTGLTMGLGYDPSDAVRVDAGLSYGKLSFETSYTLSLLDSTESVNSKGLGYLAFSSRAFLSVTEEMVLVPAVNFNYFGLGYDYAKNYTLVTAGGTNQSTGLFLGCGWQFRPDNRMTLLAGLGYGYQNTKITDSLVCHTRQDKTTASYPSITAGMEANLTGWLTVRLGAEKKILSQNTTKEFFDNTTLIEKTITQPYELNLGLALKIRGFTMDLMLNPKLIYSGGNIASGSKNWPFTRASLVYRF